MRRTTPLSTVKVAAGFEYTTLQLGYDRGIKKAARPGLNSVWLARFGSRERPGPVSGQKGSGAGFSPVWGWDSAKLDEPRRGGWAWAGDACRSAGSTGRAWFRVAWKEARGLQTGGVRGIGKRKKYNRL